MKKKYKIDEPDDVVFREPVERLVAYDSQLPDGAWQPYRGHRLRLACFGDNLGVQKFDEPDHVGQAK